MDKKRAILQLKRIEKETSKKMLLAADWKKPWQVLVSTMLSSQTKDETTIKISHKLYGKYNSLKKLANGKLADIKEIIKPVNFYKTKAGNILNTSKILVKRYNGRIPHDIHELLKLPGVGRKTANVFLAVQGKPAIGVDTHVSYLAHLLGWTKNKDKKKIEQDLEGLFPKRYWIKINYVLVRFGRTYKTRKRQAVRLGEIGVLR